MRTVLLTIALAGLVVSSAGIGGATEKPPGPRLVTAVETEGSTLVSWTPSDRIGAVYHLYRGTDVDHMVRIARTATPMYNDLDDYGDGPRIYAVTIVINGIESEPTYNTIGTESPCVSVALNGNVVLRPWSCLSMLP